MVETVKIEGLRELREALMKTVPEHMRGRVLQQALGAGARLVVTDARRRAPMKTGTLKRAIYATRNKRGSNQVREERVVTVRQGKRAGKKDAFYWRWVEFGRGTVEAGRGTRVLGKPGKGFFGRQVRAVPARPFLRPAFESQKVAAVDSIRARLAKELDAAAAKAPKYRR